MSACIPCDLENLTHQTKKNINKIEKWVTKELSNFGKQNVTTAMKYIRVLDYEQVLPDNKESITGEVVIDDSLEPQITG